MSGKIAAKRACLRERTRVEDVCAEEFEAEDRCMMCNIYAYRAILGGRCTVLGELKYVDEIRLGEGVRLARQPERVTKMEFPE